METNSRYWVIVSIGAASNSNNVSRPFRTLLTSPTFSRMWRCLVTACLVSRVPFASWEIDWGENRHSLAISDSRVSSPKAANVFAWRKNSLGKVLSNIIGNVLQLYDPARIVPAEGFEPPVGRDLVESGFGHYQMGAAAVWRKCELDECRSFPGIVDGGIDRV